MHKMIIKILFLVLVGELTAQVPDTWAIDVHQFEHTMTITAELVINRGALSSPSNVLAVFVGAECRGLVESTPVGEKDIFFLLVYANSNGETLEFRMWDAEVNNVIILDQSASFVSGSALGTVDLPTLFTGINTISFVDASDDEFEQMEDEVNNTALDILANDIYDQSLALDIVNLVEPIHGFTIENLDQTFTYVSDENFFGADSFYYRVSHIYGSDSAWVYLTIIPVDDPLGTFQLHDPPHDTLFAFEGVVPYIFTWEVPVELDDDPLTYELYVYQGDVHSNQLDTNYFSDEANVLVDLPSLEDADYVWKVIAFDGWGYRASIDTFAFRIWRHVSVEGAAFIPSTFSVGQNYPNPFNPITKIEYGLPEASEVSFTIHDLSGRLIMEESLGHQNPGWYSFDWDGTGMSGEVVVSGIYLCQIQSGHQYEVVKMLLLK